jgi:hypothetical protein
MWCCVIWRRFYPEVGEVTSLRNCVRYIPEDNKVYGNQASGAIKAKECLAYILKYGIIIFYMPLTQVCRPQYITLENIMVFMRTTTCFNIQNTRIFPHRVF